MDGHKLQFNTPSPRGCLPPPDRVGRAIVLQAHTNLEQPLVFILFSLGHSLPFPYRTGALVLVVQGDEMNWENDSRQYISSSARFKGRIRQFNCSKLHTPLTAPLRPSTGTCMRLSRRKRLQATLIHSFTIFYIYEILTGQVISMHKHFALKMSHY